MARYNAPGGFAVMTGRPRGIKNDSGTALTPRWSNGNIDWNEVRIQYVSPTISVQIAPNTLRGLMYILKSKNILKKSDYNGLITHCRDWRKAGLIEWDDIADGSGRGVINDFGDYKTPNNFVDGKVDYLRNGGAYYQRYLNGEWRWYGQPNYIEIWVEKHAIVGTVRVLVGKRYVRIAFNKGNPGWGYMHDNCERLRYELLQKSFEGKQRKVFVWYLGDDDDHGRHMDKEIKSQLKYFGLWDKIHFERIGVLPEQIEEYGLPQDFESGKGYEVDALNAYNPQAFKRLIDDHIDPFFNEDIHKKILAEHSAKSIDDLIRNKVEFLD
jgi:hypothetical protein